MKSFKVFGILTEDKLGLTDMWKTVKEHLNYTFFSIIQGLFIEIDHELAYKTNMNNLK